MELAEIRLYPVKSLGGIAAPTAQVEPWGLAGDRRWLVLEPDGAVLTARECHRMLSVTASPWGDRDVVLSGADGSVMVAEGPVAGELVPVALSRLDRVRVADREVNHWLSRQLERPVRLGWLDDPRRRTVSAAHGGLEGDALNLADAGPLLLTSTASLRQLDTWMAEGAAERGEEPPPAMAMGRFRPNVVVDGDQEPFAEDGWRGVRIGAVRFRFAERCDRCVMTTIEPRTLATGKEPLRTLARHRRHEGRTWFGIRLIPVTSGTIRRGDPVEAS